MTIEKIEQIISFLSRTYKSSCGVKYTVWNDRIKFYVYIRAGFVITVDVNKKDFDGSGIYGNCKMIEDMVDRKIISYLKEGGEHAQKAGGFA